jgi:hypothetical protein
MPAPRYTLDLLQEACGEYDAILRETYESCNATTLIRFTCKCGQEGEKRMRSIVDQNGMTCNSCSQKQKVETQKKTCLERYGVEHTSLVPEIKAKIDATNLARYGTTTPQFLPEIRQKVIETNLKKYGVTCTVHAPEIKKKVIATNLARFGTEYAFQAESVKEKSRATTLERYGVEHASAAPDVKEKVAQTNLARRGVRSAMQSEEVRQKAYATNMAKYGVKVARQAPEIKEKAKQTCLKRYGVDHPLKVPAFRQKAKDTLMKNYGVQHIMHSPTLKERMRQSNLCKYGVPYTCQVASIMEKIQRNSKNYKSYTMPSGTVRRVQGYEPFALDDLLKTYTEDQIKTDRRDVPRIQYQGGGIQRVYFPDIFLPHENKIIEVKSSWTYQCKADNVAQKKQACLDQGYACEIWCYDGNRVRTVL